MKQATKIKSITFEDTFARIFKGKYGEFSWKSPRWGYKKGYKYNQLIYIYLGKPSDLSNAVQLDKVLLKDATKKDILVLLENFKASRKYLRAIKGN